jgi:hypothetical protein
LESVVILNLTAYHENVGIGEHSFRAATALGHRATADLGVLGACLAPFAFELHDDNCNQVHGHDPMSVGFAGHREDFAVDVDVSLVGLAFEGEVFVHSHQTLQFGRGHGQILQGIAEQREFGLHERHFTIKAKKIPPLGGGISMLLLQPPRNAALIAGLGGDYITSGNA